MSVQRKSTSDYVRNKALVT